MDAYHYFGNDLQLDSTGDLQTVDSVQESQQFILRRLLTNQGDYLWDLNYGAGLGGYIGQPIDETQVETQIRSQMFLEESVVQNPAPQVTFESFQGGISAVIKYVETDSNQPTTLSFTASNPGNA